MLIRWICPVYHVRMYDATAKRCTRGHARTTPSTEQVTNELDVLSIVAAAHETRPHSSSTYRLSILSTAAAACDTRPRLLSTYSNEPIARRLAPEARRELGPGQYGYIEPIPRRLVEPQLPTTEPSQRTSVLAGFAARNVRGAICVFHGRRQTMWTLTWQMRDELFPLIMTFSPESKSGARKKSND